MTSFMQRRGSQARQYELMKTKIKEQREQLKKKETQDSGPESRQNSDLQAVVSPLGERIPATNEVIRIQDESNQQPDEPIRINTGAVEVRPRILNFHDERTCKYCGFFGCEGECQSIEEEEEQTKKSNDVPDEG